MFNTKLPIFFVQFIWLGWLGWLFSDDTLPSHCIMKYLEQKCIDVNGFQQSNFLMARAGHRQRRQDILFLYTAGSCYNNPDVLAEQTVPLYLSSGHSSVKITKILLIEPFRLHGNYSSFTQRQLPQ